MSKLFGTAAAGGGLGFPLAGIYTVPGTAAANPALLQPPKRAVLEEQGERTNTNGTQPAWDCSLLPPRSHLSLFSSKGSRVLLSLSPVSPS